MKSVLGTPLGGSGQPCCCLKGACGGLAWPRTLLHSQLSHGGAGGCNRPQRQLCRARRGCACLAAATSTAAGTRKAAGAKAAVKDISAKKSRTRKKEAEPEEEAQEEKPRVLPDWLAGRESELLAQQAEVDARYADRKLGESRRAQVRFLLPLPFAPLSAVHAASETRTLVVLGLQYRACVGSKAAFALQRTWTQQTEARLAARRGDRDGVYRAVSEPKVELLRQAFPEECAPSLPPLSSCPALSCCCTACTVAMAHVELLMQAFLRKCVPSISPLTSCSVVTLYLRHRCCRKMRSCRRRVSL